jgi:hypothetical protein
MTDNIKQIDIKEFREKGYLQELNRNFLHPLGLALEIAIFEDGTEKLNGICDYRNDKEGVYYDIANSDTQRIEKFKQNQKFIESEIKKRIQKRKELFGNFIEPIE